MKKKFEYLKFLDFFVSSDILSDEWSLADSGRKILKYWGFHLRFKRERENLYCGSAKLLLDEIHVWHVQSTCNLCVSDCTSCDFKIRNALDDILKLFHITEFHCTQRFVYFNPSSFKCQKCLTNPASAKKTWPKHWTQHDRIRYQENPML